MSAEKAAAEPRQTLTAGPRSIRSIPADRPRTVRLLEGTRIPRLLRRHDTVEGTAYRRYLMPKLQRLGLWPLPDWAVDPARECGHAFIDLGRLRVDLEALHARRGAGVRRQEERKLRGEIRKTRISLLVQERRLEKLAQGNGHHRVSSAGELLAAMKRAGDG